jgi:hypothetical protein
MYHHELTVASDVHPFDRRRTRRPNRHLDGGERAVVPDVQPPTVHFRLAMIG